MNRLHYLAHRWPMQFYVLASMLLGAASVGFIWAATERSVWWAAVPGAVIALIPFMVPSRPHE